MKPKELLLSVYHSVRLRYGVKITRKNTLPVIVSLTSIPSRLSTLDIVITSLLSQTHPPKQIILWLNTDLKSRLPRRLLALENGIFEIRYGEGTSSYRKLLPTLKQFPDATIVTCDDDMIYPDSWLNNLYKCHLSHPHFVLSQVGRMISRNKNQELEEYKKWKFIRHESIEDNFLPIGCGGVLYPVGTFTEEVFNEDKYMKLSPTADDLWFKAMSYLNGKKSYCVSEKATPIPVLRAQKKSLGKNNVGLDANRSQWQALCKHYPDLTFLG